MSRSQLREVWIIILKQIFPFFSFFFLFLSPRPLPPYHFSFLSLSFLSSRPLHEYMCIFVHIYFICIRTHICKDDYNVSIYVYTHVFISFYIFFRITIIIHGAGFMKLSRINQYIHSIPYFLN